MSLKERYRIKEFRRVEHKFLDCEKVLIISELDHSGAPVELLFFNAYENINLILEHCMDQKRRWWEFPSKLSRDNLPLIGAQLNSCRFESFKQASQPILELIDQKKLVLFRVDTFYQPNRPNYLVEHRQGHMIAIKDYEAKDLKTEFLVLDDLDIKDLSKLFLGSEVVEQMYNHSLFNEIYYLDYDGSFDIQLNHILALFKAELGKIESCPNAIHHIKRFIGDDNKSFSNSNEKFLYLSDAFKLLSGSRELFSQFLSHISFNETIAKEVQECAELAEIIYLSFIKSSISGSLSPTILDGCAAYFEREDKLIESLKSEYVKNNARYIDYQAIP
jgi:hypothetical protein